MIRGSEKEILMSHIDKAQIIIVLRDRGMSERADWVDREFSSQIDAHANASLLRMLKLEPDVLAAATVPG
jgi:hypothetical protein